jgi:hypothetical protein
MWKIYVPLALVWVCLLPPWFTDGACTSEFDRAYAQVTGNQAALTSPNRAKIFLESHRWQTSQVSPEQCRHLRPRVLDRCGAGMAVLGQLPVENRICRFYRDDAIRIQLQYDEHDRLSRMVVEMNPFKSLRLPFGTTLHWAR